LRNKPLGRHRGAARLHQDVEHVAVLVDRAPPVRGGAVDLHQHLVHVPLTVSTGWLDAAFMVLRIEARALSGPATHSPPLRPPSILITTLAARAYRRQDDLGEPLLEVIDDMLWAAPG
jgi:cytochrome P450